LNLRNKISKRIQSENFENTSKTYQEKISNASEFDDKDDDDFNESISRRDFSDINTQHLDLVNKGSQQAIQFKNILTNLKVDISCFNSLLSKKRKNYEDSFKKQNESKDKMNVFYNDYNNFLIKFFHFNLEGNYNHSNNGYEEFSSGLNKDSGSNQNFKDSNENYYYQKDQSTKNNENKKSDYKIIGNVYKNFKNFFCLYYLITIISINIIPQ